MTLSAYLGGVTAGLISTALVFGYALIGWNIVGAWPAGSIANHAR
ncbi:MAG: hypothetical protein ABI411_00675 [Tahibacter sp.]